ncbi:stability determinant [Brevundimonas sp. LM2]|uniref:type II toxin-antitoxin system RelB family antitoxin n=1 Tax=Brevundimonas sp. LM2 TaxID=1938605 RepID=UPI000983B60D|nr:stability determinant [Brevundimonas sp. LM2]AQR60327.1 stability determinant [Brevundimonas sp. LM2]
MPALDPIVSEFASTEDEAAYDVWFRAKVREALANPGPDIPHDEVVARIKARLASLKT